MIYISSSCVKNSKIKDSVIELNNAGFKNIELSGGTEAYPEMLTDLIELKEKYNLNYRCHNYFPPPEKHFVFNLGALDDETLMLSKKHLETTLMLSEKLEANKFAFHAGFLVKILVSELGKKIKKKEFFSRKESLDSFVKNVNFYVSKYSNIQLYIENNVFSHENFQSYEGKNPLLMTDLKSINEVLEKVDAKLLLDIAHLKVSTKTLGLNFSKELAALLTKTDYIHVSDNDGLADSNQKLGDEMMSLLVENKENLINKDFTLEIYSGLRDVSESYNKLLGIINE